MGVYNRLHTKIISGHCREWIDEGDALICFNCLHIQPPDEFDVFFEHDVIKSVAFLKDVRDYYAKREDGFEEYKGWTTL